MKKIFSFIFTFLIVLFFTFINISFAFEPSSYEIYNGIDVSEWQRSVNFREVKENSQLKALVYNDLRLIFRTPQLFMNCVAILLYVPILLILLILSNNISGLSEIINNNEKLVIVSIYLITVLLISIGNVSITSISREGKDILVSKYIPASK